MRDAAAAPGDEGRLEVDKWKAKLDSAKATNDLLTLQLKESRLTAENMFIALTKVLVLTNGCISQI
jgi:hypothetical protein